MRTATWSVGDYPCFEAGFPSGERCSDSSCGRVVARADLELLYGEFWAEARTEPTTSEVVAEVTRLGQEIARIETLLDEDRL